MNRTGLFEWKLANRRPESPSVDYLIAESHHILDRAMDEHLASAVLPLFSGGNDSACSVHISSLHSSFSGTVYTINTRTGAFKTKLHQRRVCDQFGWNQEVRRSPNRSDNMEEFVRRKGCPGPGMHPIIFARLKQRVLRLWVKEHKRNGRPVALISGVRSHESRRRLGYSKEIQRGGGINATSGQLYEPLQLWVAPILNWTSEDKRRYMKHFKIPYNPFTGTLDMSGECFCGSFADQGEKESIALYAPDVLKKIEILERIAREHGKHDKWGTAPSNDPPIEGPIPQMCQGCYARTLFP